MTALVCSVCFPCHFVVNHPHSVPNFNPFRSCFCRKTDSLYHPDWAVAAPPPLLLRRGDSDMDCSSLLPPDLLSYRHTDGRDRNTRVGFQRGRAAGKEFQCSTHVHTLISFNCSSRNIFSWYIIIVFCKGSDLCWQSFNSSFSFFFFSCAVVKSQTCSWSKCCSQYLHPDDRFVFRRLCRVYAVYKRDGCVSFGLLI